MIVRLRPSLQGFEEDAVKAMTENPAYFVRWYTIKSVGLGVVGAFAAFMVGIHFGSKRRK